MLTKQNENKGKKKVRREKRIFTLSIYIYSLLGRNFFDDFDLGTFLGLKNLEWEPNFPWKGHHIILYVDASKTAFSIRFRRL